MARPESYIEQSKREWWMRGEHSIEQLTLGCLQRIATATEAMAKYHVQIIKERDDYKRWYNESLQRAEKRDRRIAALKGVITKLQRKRKESGNG